MNPIALLLIGLLAAQNAQDAPNQLAAAQVYAVAMPLNSEAEVREMQRLDVDVLVRGVRGLWGMSPHQVPGKLHDKQTIMAALRDAGILAMPMTNSTFICFTDDNYDLSPLLQGTKFDDYVARNAAGGHIPVSGMKPEMGCLNNPLCRNYILGVLRSAIDNGAPGFHIDEAYGHYLWGSSSSPSSLPCFCDDCSATFRDYLRQRVSYKTLRETYGIDPNVAFDFRAWLAEHKHTDNPPAASLWPLFWHCQVLATKRQEQAIADAARDYAWEHQQRKIVLHSNQWGAGGGGRPSAVTDMETEVYDFACIGLTWEINRLFTGKPYERVRASYLPGGLSFMPQFKAIHAQDSAKPTVAFFDKYSAGAKPPFFKDLPRAQQAAWIKWAFATSYVSGGFLALPWRHMDLELPMDDMAAWTSFFGKKRDIYTRYFRGSRPLADVGLLYAYPSELWQWSMDEVGHRQHYLGAAMALTAAHIDYKAIFLGDGEICPTRATANDLADLSVLLAPNCNVLTDDNLALLDRYTAAGGKILATGAFAGRDGMNVPRPAPRPAVDIQTDHQIFRHDPSVIPALTGQLATLGVQPGVTLDPPNLRVDIPRRTSGGGGGGGGGSGALLIDLLNADWHDGTGFAQLPAFTVTVRLPAHLRGKPLHATLAAPDIDNGSFHPTTLRPIDADHVAITIPGVPIYALVVVEP